MNNTLYDKLDAICNALCVVAAVLLFAAVVLYAGFLAAAPATICACAGFISFAVALVVGLY